MLTLRVMAGMMFFYEKYCQSELFCLNLSGKFTQHSTNRIRKKAIYKNG